MSEDVKQEKAMKKRTVVVTITVEVEFDESKFTPEWMEEFRKYFYDFNTTDEHAEHLGQMFARELATDTSFIEGYGMAQAMGIRFNIVNTETEVSNG